MNTIGSGPNILRIIDYKTQREGIYDLHLFRVRNLAGDKTSFGFKSPAGARPARIIRDLQELNKQALWAKFDLREKQGFLAISSIREPERCQEELQAMTPEGVGTRTKLVNLYS